ncbi:MAG: hypothetical protein JNM30_17320 [Rhodospirillales bacterium]|nr:hypothetical protein [Rhodospirillales bacterium]
MRAALAGPAAAVMLAIALLCPALAQTGFDRGRAYDQCASEAYRNAGPPPRHNPRPGDDLVALERTRQAHEDAYYRALDRCLRRNPDPRQPRRY